MCPSNNDRDYRTGIRTGIRCVRYGVRQRDSTRRDRNPDQHNVFCRRKPSSSLRVDTCHRNNQKRSFPARVSCPRLRFRKTTLGPPSMIFIGSYAFVEFQNEERPNSSGPPCYSGCPLPCLAARSSRQPHRYLRQRQGTLSPPPCKTSGRWAGYARKKSIHSSTSSKQSWMRSSTPGLQLSWLLPSNRMRLMSNARARRSRFTQQKRRTECAWSFWRCSGNSMRSSSVQPIYKMHFSRRRQLRKVLGRSRAGAALPLLFRR